MRALREKCYSTADDKKGGKRLEQHIAYALEVVENEIKRLEYELKHGHYLREDIEIMNLDILRLRTAVSDIREQFRANHN